MKGTPTEPEGFRPTAAAAWRRTPTSVRAHERGVPRWRAYPAREDRHGPIANMHSSATRSSTGSSTCITTAPATPGASIRCNDFAHGQNDDD